MKHQVFLSRVLFALLGVALLLLVASSLDAPPAVFGSLSFGSVFTLVLTGAALGADAMSLAVGIGIRGISRREGISVTLIIGLFHVIMPLMGVAGGSYFSRRAGGIAQVVGAAIVAVIGIRMIWGCLSCGDAGGKKEWKLTGLSLVLLALCVSMDAFSVGLGLGALGFNALFASFIFGLFGAGMTIIGLYLGRKMCTLVGKYGELFGGAVLVVLAIKMFLEG